MPNRIDNNYHSIADQTDVELKDQQFVNLPAGYDDVLKISNSQRVNVENCIIEGGKEDCIDMMRFSADVTIKDTILIPKGEYASTIKGGCRNIRFENVLIDGRGSTADIDLGNFNHVTTQPVRGVTLVNVMKKDGSPVVVRVLNSDKPSIIGGNVKLKVVPPILVKIAVFFMSIYFKLTK